MLDEDGLGDHRTDAARTQESGKSSEGMNEKDDELANLSILARTANPRNCAANQQFARDRLGYIIRSVRPGNKGQPRSV